MVNTAIRIDQETLDRLDYLAGKVGTTRSQMLRNCLEIGIDDVTALDKVGLLKVGCSIRDFAEWIKSGQQQKLPLES